MLPVGSDQRHGDVVMYDPQSNLARGNPMPQSMTFNDSQSRGDELSAVQRNSEQLPDQLIRESGYGPMAQLRLQKHDTASGLQSQSDAMRRDIRMNAEQHANALKSEREAEMKYRSAMNTIGDQEKQIKELRAMVEQMMNNQQQQQPAQAAPTTVPPTGNSFGCTPNTCGCISTRTFC